MKIRTIFSSLLWYLVNVAKSTVLKACLSNDAMLLWQTEKVLLCLYCQSTSLIFFFLNCFAKASEVLIYSLSRFSPFPNMAPSAATQLYQRMFGNGEAIYLHGDTIWHLRCILIQYLRQTKILGQIYLFFCRIFRKTTTSFS